MTQAEKNMASITIKIPIKISGFNFKDLNLKDLFEFVISWLKIFFSPYLLLHYLRHTGQEVCCCATN